MMTLWEQASIVAAAARSSRRRPSTAQMAGTDGNHIYGSVPFGCADARRAVHRRVQLRGRRLLQWDGETLNVVVPVFSGLDLVAGTELKPGP